MKPSSYTQEALVIENPSKALLDFVNKLRDRKMSQQEKLRNKKKTALLKLTYSFSKWIFPFLSILNQKMSIG